MSAPHALDLSFPLSRPLRVAAAFLLLFLLAVRAFAGQATLAWNSSTDPTVTGYKLYYGQASNSYAVTVDVGKVTTYTVLNLTEGKTYYYVVKAVGSGGAESPPSNEVSGTIPFAPPVASFGASATSGIAPLAVNFTSTATGNITAYAWSFGDGTSSTSANPSKTYSAPGTYTVSHTVTGPGGTNTATKTSLITVSAAPPVAGITASTSTGAAPLAVQFTSASTGTISSYAWNFGNGTTSNVQNPPAVTYTAAGSYPVSLTVTGPGGGSTKSATITVTAPAANQAPNATIVSPVAPVVVTEGQSVTFQGTGNDPDGNTPLAYSWNFGSAAAASTAQNPTVTFTTAGTYTVNLRVTDSKGLADPTPATLAVTVNPKPNQAPNGSIVAPAAAVTVTAGQSVAFQGSGSDPDGNTPLTYSWNFGSAAAASTAQNPTVTFTTAGTYTAELRVTDSKGLADPTPATLAVTVNPKPNQAPNGMIVAPAAAVTVTAGQSVAFQASGTDPDGNGPLTYSWDFGGGAAASSAQNPTVTFSSPGTYTVKLAVTDAKGLTDPTPATIVATVTAATAAPTPSIPGLVAAYGFNEGTGTTVGDSSGNRNSGTISNANWATNGRFGKALSFNGTNSWVTVPDSPNLDLTTGMTLQAWVYPQGSLSGWRSIVMKEQSGLDAYSIETSTPGHVVGRISASGSIQNMYSSNTIPLNAWTHLAVTYDGSRFNLYVNGIRAASLANRGPIQTSGGPLRIGGNSIWGEHFQGRIDEIRIYNRALSASEIIADMNNPLP